MNITSKEESEALDNGQRCFLPEGSSLLVLSLKRKTEKRERISEEERLYRNKVEVP